MDLIFTSTDGWFLRPVHAVARPGHKDWRHQLSTPQDPGPHQDLENPGVDFRHGSSPYPRAQGLQRISSNLPGTHSCPTKRRGRPGGFFHPTNQKQEVDPYSQRFSEYVDPGFVVSSTSLGDRSLPSIASRSCNWDKA